MSPTIFKIKNRKYFFFSNEEPRMHVHVSSPDGEAKFWIEPVVALATSEGFSPKLLKEIQKDVEDKYEEIKKAWKKHFKN